MLSSDLGRKPSPFQSRPLDLFLFFFVFFSLFYFMETHWAGWWAVMEKKENGKRNRKIRKRNARAGGVLVGQQFLDILEGGRRYAHNTGVTLAHLLSRRHLFLSFFQPSSSQYRGQGHRTLTHSIRLVLDQENTSKEIKNQIQKIEMSWDDKKGRAIRQLPNLPPGFNSHFIFCVTYFRPGPVDHITDALNSLTTSSDESHQVKAKNESSTVASAANRNQRKPDPLTGLAVQRQPIDRKQELCQRHVQQLFIRGEQVALVAVLPLWHCCCSFVFFFSLYSVSSSIIMQTAPTSQEKNNKSRKSTFFFFAMTRAPNNK